MRRVGTWIAAGGLLLSMSACGGGGGSESTGERPAKAEALSVGFVAEPANLDFTATEDPKLVVQTIVQDEFATSAVRCGLVELLREPAHFDPMQIGELCRFELIAIAGRRFGCDRALEVLDCERVVPSHSMRTAE